MPSCVQIIRFHIALLGNRELRGGNHGIGEARKIIHILLQLLFIIKGVDLKCTLLTGALLHIICLTISTILDLDFQLPASALFCFLLVIYGSGCSFLDLK